MVIVNWTAEEPGVEAHKHKPSTESREVKARVCYLARLCQTNIVEEML